LAIHAAGSVPRLSREEYARTHGADQADIDKVHAFAATHGLTVTESHAGRRAITLEGTAVQFEVAFGVTLNHYEGPLPTGGRRPGSTPREASEVPAPAPALVRHGYDGPVYLPNDLAGIVLAVVGLDDRSRSIPCGGPAAAGNDPPGASALSVPNLAQRYNFPSPNPGAGDQTIGVIAPSGAAYLASDIRNVYIPSLPSAYQTVPTIHDVTLTVSGTLYQNSPSTVQGITASNFGSAAYGGVLELTQDISTAATNAQGATINVYFTADSEQGWLVFLNRVLLPETTENGPTVVTCSWTLELGDDSSYVGNLTNSGSLVSLMTAQFQALAGVGIDVFIAQGDWGADD
jgi:subtilase family serine protease